MLWSGGAAGGGRGSCRPGAGAMADDEVAVADLREQARAALAAASAEGQLAFTALDAASVEEEAEVPPPPPLPHDMAPDDEDLLTKAAPQYYGFGAAPAAGGPAAGGPAAGGEWALAIPAAAAGASSTAGDCPDEYARPWFTEKDGGYYCELCGAWADWTHLQCERHRKRSANPEWYGFALRAQPAQQAAPQDGWSKYFSTEHNCYYYHNAQTKITQWEPPYAAAEALPTPMPQASSAPVASSAAATAAAAAAAAAEPRLPTTRTTPAAKERLPAPWKEYFHSDGRAYYYNPETKVSQWEFPLEVC